MTSNTTPSQNGPGSNTNEGVFTFTKAPALEEPHHQIVLCHISGHSLGGPTPLQSCSWCILQT